MSYRYHHPKSSEITPESIYQQRRQWLQSAAVLGAAWALKIPAAQAAGLGARIRAPHPQTYRLNEPWTPYEDVTGYNNYYEFGLDKGDPKAQAGQLVTDPWSVRIGGLCHRPGQYALEDLVSPYALEDRVYRFRCVEAWSMVIPWLGFPLADLIKRAQPAASARYISLTTLQRPEQMPGQRSIDLHWPYREGLRLDEAMHPLSFIALGLYGRPLLAQNGAPLRLVVPWKYGFKSIKSIVAIDFLEQMPISTWARMAPSEYGFYANVNPHVDHPRWSQARERRLPNGLFSPHWQPTLMFNGYAQEVAELYRGMDLRRYF